MLGRLMYSSPRRGPMGPLGSPPPLGPTQRPKLPLPFADRKHPRQGSHGCAALADYNRSLRPSFEGKG
eukprot:5211266-Prymnesium_polylepis.1